VSSLKRNLRGQTEGSIDWISPRTIFRNSTINSLSYILRDFLNDGTIPQEDLELSRTRVVDEAVAKYSEGLPSKSPSTAVSTVAVIGSTGYLGPYIVASLIKDPEISLVFCLNRSKDTQARQEALLCNLDQNIAPLLHKLVFMTIKLDQVSLGLSPEDSQMVTNEVDTIIFNSWESNFVLPLRHFNPFLNATRELIRLAASTSRQMRIVFVSSLASVGSMARRTTVSESLVQDPLAALNNGYGQSKLAAERILAAGYEQSGVPVSVVRLGQIGGPTQAYTGKWADQGWISAIVKTARTMKSIPSDGPLIDWLPVDIVAQMLHKVVVSQCQDGLRFYNALQPNPRSWDLFVEVLRESLDVQHTVPLQIWVKKLREIRGTSANSKAEMPALTLLDYYEECGGSEVPTYETGSIWKDSQIVVPALDKDILKTWLSGWAL
jgi:thioester reductase-like protein